MGDKSWEEAFLAYGLDAAVGRLFRGLTHNLNGVAQAFSMQTELLGMLFSRSEEILRQLEQASTLEEARALGGKLAEVIKRRAALVVHLDKEVRVMQEIMHRSGALMEGVGDPERLKVYSLKDVIETELEFMNGDGFFKHRVGKHLDLAENLPPLRRHFLEIHQIVGALLENAAQALAEGEVGVAEEAPELRLNCTADADQLVLSVADNGPGVPVTDQELIFAPFYTTRPGRLGLGLHLARKLTERCHGTLHCEAIPGRTRFTLRMPLAEVGLGQ